jgi:hypothetical protein
MTGYKSKRAMAQDKLAQPAQEPVAWMFQHDETGQTMCVDAQQVEYGFEKGNPRLKKIAPLYTTSPQRTWVDLTPQDLNKIFEVARTGEHAVNLALDKVKEKNNG